MLLLIARIAEYLLYPSNALGLVALAGLAALLVGWRRSGGVVLGLAGALFMLLGWLPFGPAALMLLENRFPPPELTTPVAGIIMLGGEIDTHITGDRGGVALTDAAERLTSTAELSRRFPAARIILSGGAVAHLLTGAGETEALLARDVLVATGVSAERIELEERSHTTWENALESKQLAQPQPGQRWLLVTSASHMPRAVAAFRAVGFEIVPYPVDYRTRGSADLVRPVSTIAQGLQDLDLAAHEWIGLLAYRLTKTREFFPAPG